MATADRYVKKHWTQMRPQERYAALRLVPKGSSVRLTKHARGQMEKELLVDESTVRRIFDEPDYIPEFAWSGTTKAWKLVVRHADGWCAVVTMDGTVPTVWFNPPEDQHETLNLNVYDGTLDVCGLIRTAARSRKR